MPVQAYTCGKDGFDVTSTIKADFDKKGFVIVRNLLTDAEVTKLRQALEKSDFIKKYAYDVEDGAEGKSKMCLWMKPGDDVTGKVARSEKLAGTCEKLLGGEVDHCASKLMMKEPYGGGRWSWHQDYGYWYNNTYLFPDMMTVFLAVDRCYEGNGCLRMLEGSHRCGRINHNMTGAQIGADLERVEMIKARCPEVVVELNPGDAVFFHSNVLHTSSKNNSADRRWALANVYNRSDNLHVQRPFPYCTQLDKVPNSSIMEGGDVIDVAEEYVMTPEERKEEYAHFVKATA